MKKPVPPTDPIAIAALVAELPDLHAGLALSNERLDEAKADTKAWRDRVSAHQARIDDTIEALRSQAPKDTKWGKREFNSQDIQEMLVKMNAQLQAKKAHGAQNQNAANQLLGMQNAGAMMPQAQQNIAIAGTPDVQAIMELMRRQELHERNMARVAKPPVITELNRGWGEDA